MNKYPRFANRPSLSRSLALALTLGFAGTTLLAAEPGWTPISRPPSPMPTSPSKNGECPALRQPATDVVPVGAFPSVAPELPASILPVQLPEAAAPLTVGAASQDLESRVRELEAKLKLLDASATTTEPKSPASSSIEPAAPPTLNAAGTTPFTSGWDRQNGFFVGSPDGKNRLRLTGQIQGDYRDYTDEGQSAIFDTFVVRRARLGIEANVFQFHEFRFLTEFGAGNLNGGTTVTATPRTVDAFYNMHYWDGFQVEAGKFKQPFSYEQLAQDRFTPFMERSLIDQLVPARDVGFMLHGQKLFGDRLDYGMSVFNGEQNGDTDSNSAKDYAFRLAARPFKGVVSCLDYLQLGMAYTTGIEQESMNGFVMRTPSGIPFFQFLNNVRADGLRNRMSPELVYFLGALGFAGQWFHMEQHFDTPNGRTNVLVPFDGYYVMSSYLLTGETRTGYSANIEPLEPFDPRHGSYGPGAWELAGRLSRIRMSDSVFNRSTQLANPNLYSNGATETTLGFNWYLNGFVRVQFNWEHTAFDRRVQLGSTARTLYQFDDALMTRVQIQF